MNELQRELITSISGLTDRQACIALEAWLYQLKHPETTPEECVHQAAEAAQNAPLCAENVRQKNEQQ